jgi:hypothetical protein
MSVSGPGRVEFAAVPSRMGMSRLVSADSEVIWYRSMSAHRLVS